MKLASSSRGKFFAALIVLGIIAGAVKFHSRSPALPSVITLPEMETLPTEAPSMLDQVPISWTWIWRARTAIFPRRGLTIDSQICDLRNSTLTDWLPSGEPVFSGPKGLRVWVTDDADLNALRRKLKSAGRVRASPRMNTAEEIGGKINMTENVVVDGKQEGVGITSEFIPRINGEVIDLMNLTRWTSPVTNRVADTEVEVITIYTNLSLATRLQILSGKGAFVLSESNGDGNAYGVFISAKLQPAKR